MEISAIREVDTVYARDNFATVINHVAYNGENLILKRRGKPIVAIVSLEDLVLLETARNRGV
jgi:antitoxin (DNA-binding transcriptional repressor) of toxin-antitoxin stability system